MKIFFTISIILVFFVSCRESTTLGPDEFYSDSFPKDDLNLSFFKIPKDKLEKNIDRYTFYSNSIPIGRPPNLQVFEEIDFSDIIFFKIKKRNLYSLENKLYEFDLYFNTTNLKNFLNSQTAKAKEMYGPKAIVGFGIGIINPDNKGFSETFSKSSIQGTSINADLLKDGELIKFQDLCPFYQNYGTSICNLGGRINGLRKIGEKFKFSFYSGCSLDGTISLGYISSSKTYEFDLLELSKIN